MSASSTLLLPLLLFLAALLYAAVGHAGASGYLAAMALLGVAPEAMKPTALVLNLVVASLGTWRFARNSRSLFRPTGMVCVHDPNWTCDR